MAVVSDTVPAYINSLTDGLAEVSANFLKFQDANHGRRVLAYVGALKRLKPQWKPAVQVALEKGKALVSEFRMDIAAQSTALTEMSDLLAKLQQLESITSAGELDEGDDLFALFVLDDLLVMRDRLQLVIDELMAMRIEISDDVPAALAQFDKRASGNDFVRMNKSSVSGHYYLFEPSTLKGLWWWPTTEPDASAMRTADCLSDDEYVEFARSEWPLHKASGHAAACDYCQDRLAAIWSTECPGLETLQQYLQDSGYRKRTALEKHLRQFGCSVCASRIESLQSIETGIGMLNEWISLTWDAEMEALHAADDRRHPVQILEILDDPQLTFEVQERDGRLFVKFTTKEPSLGEKTIEFRLIGRRFETRGEASFERMTDNVWEAVMLIPVSEDRLRDLAGKTLISIRIRD